MDSEQEIVRHQYLTFWEQGLRRLGGWDPERVEKWMSTVGSSLISNDWTYHEEPIYWIVPHLLPESVRAWRGLPLVNAINTVAFKVAGFPNRLKSLETFDWDSAEKRFREAIAELRPVE